MNIRPLKDRLVIKREDVAEKIGSMGLFIPPATIEKEKPLKGTVQAVGEDVNQSLIGCEVLFNRYGPTEIQLDGEELLIAKEEDLLAVLE